MLIFLTKALQNYTKLSRCPPLFAIIFQKKMASPREKVCKSNFRFTSRTIIQPNVCKPEAQPEGGKCLSKTARRGTHHEINAPKGLKSTGRGDSPCFWSERKTERRRCDRANHSVALSGLPCGVPPFAGTYAPACALTPLRG